MRTFGNKAHHRLRRMRVMIRQLDTGNQLIQQSFPDAACIRIDGFDLLGKGAKDNR